MFTSDKDSFMNIGRGIDNVILGRITTITCFFNIDITVDLSDVLYYFSSTNVELFTLRVPGSKRSKHKNHTPFFNSLSLVYKYDKKRKICCKLFRTGFHMTGGNSFQMCIDICQLVCVLLKDITNSVVHVTKYTIQLVNVLLDVEQSIDIDNVIRHINCEKNITCHYDIERYSGLRVKIDLDRYTCTLLIFPSGKVMISGVKTANDVEVMNEIISKYVFPNK